MHIAFLPLPQFSNLCLANAIEPLRAANQIAQKPLFRWTVTGLGDTPVASSSGLTFTPDRLLDALIAEAERDDLLMVVASFEFRDHATADLARSLRTWARSGRAIGGLDTGAWMLADAGLLDGYRATIHADDLEPFAEAFPRVEAIEARYVVDRGRITAGGATITLDLMLDLIRDYAGARIRDGVAAMLLYDRDRTGAGPQRPALLAEERARVSPRLARALRLMQAHVDDPLPITDLARRAGVSQRHLERLCRRELGETAIARYLSIRVEAAQRLIRDTDQRLAEVAARTGFSSAAALRRAYVARYGMSPRDARRRRVWVSANTA